MVASCRSSRGFTLIEVLIALVITASLLTLLSGLFYSVTGRWEERAESSKEQFAQARARYLLRRSIEGAIPYLYRSDNRQRDIAVLFRGEQASMQWVTANSVFSQQAVIARLQLEESVLGQALVYSEFRLTGGGEFGDNLGKLVVRDGLSSIAFRYFGGGGINQYLGGQLQSRSAGFTPPVAPVASPGAVIADPYLYRRSLLNAAREAEAGSRPANTGGRVSSSTNAAATGRLGQRWHGRYDGAETRLLPETVALVLTSAADHESEWLFPVLESSVRYLEVVNSDG